MPRIARIDTNFYLASKEIREIGVIRGEKIKNADDTDLLRKDADKNGFLFKKKKKSAKISVFAIGNPRHQRSKSQQ